MKKIEAYIRPEKVDAIVDALEREGHPGLSVSEAKGYGKQRGVKDQWLGQYQPRTFQPKVRLEIIVHDTDVNRIIKAILEAAQTKNFGDGKIFVSNVEDAIRIRTGQRGEIALD